MKKTLIIMAWWLWLRYWWLKQIDWFGPNNEMIMEYSMYDALKSWADQILVVIKREHEEQITQKLWAKMLEKYPIRFVYQDMQAYIPQWIDTDHRLKPRWTGHAVLVCKEYVMWSFVVINADDWYGFSWMSKMFSLLEWLNGKNFAMIWYPLSKTMPKSWSVNRWICTVSWTHLQSIQESHWIHRDGQQQTYTSNELQKISPETIVSINFWWFSQHFFSVLQEQFLLFLEKYASDPKKEFYIPSVCNTLLESHDASCLVAVSDEQWSWVTNIEDKPLLQEFLEEKVMSWYYPQKLRK